MNDERTMNQPGYFSPHNISSKTSSDESDLPDGQYERIIIMVAVLTGSMPAHIRVALMPAPQGGWGAVAMRGGADVRSALGNNPLDALMKLEEGIALDAATQRNTLSKMLSAWKRFRDKRAGDSKDPYVIQYDLASEEDEGDESEPE